MHEERSNIFETYRLLKDQLGELTHIGNIISTYSSSAPLHEMHAWTMLKLCFLKLYIQRIYTPIIKSYYQNMFYIDLFAGSGLNQFEDHSTLVPGSPIIAWTFAYRSFDYLYLVEKETKYSRPLEERMKLISLPENFRIYHGGDANKEYLDIIGEIEETASSHFFAFVDPYAFQLRWETLERLLTSRVRGDFLVLFQPHYTAMQAGSVIKGRIKDARTLNELFGDEVWVEYIKDKHEAGENMVKSVLEYYTRKIRRVRKRETIIETIEVPLFGGASYFLLFVTNKTARENPWMGKVMNLKNLIEKGDSQMVGDVISDILGRPRSILSYIS